MQAQSGVCSWDGKRRGEGTYGWGKMEWRGCVWNGVALGRETGSAESRARERAGSRAESRERERESFFLARAESPPPPPPASFARAPAQPVARIRVPARSHVGAREEDSTAPLLAWLCSYLGSHLYVMYPRLPAGFQRRRRGQVRAGRSVIVAQSLRCYRLWHALT